MFPHTSFWCIYSSSQCLMLATPERLSIDYQELSKRLSVVLKSSELDQYGVDTVEKFLSFFMLGEDKLAEMLAGFDKINTDDMPRAHFHPRLNPAGIQTALDLMKYQESIFPYLTNVDDGTGARVKRVKETLAAYIPLGFPHEQPVRIRKSGIVGV